MLSRDNKGIQLAVTPYGRVKGVVYELAFIE